MNIKQFRDVLEKAATTHSRLDADEAASALRALASALKSHDKLTVQRFVADVKKFRKTGGTEIRRARESA
jgi:hypothetical protein